MVQTLEAIKGGGGSIRVGATGTIGSLMTRELESMKCRTQTPISSRRRPPVPDSVSCGATANGLQPRRASNELICSSSNSSGRISNTNHESLENIQKTRRNIQTNNHRIPILGSENVALERTPYREKPERKGSYIAEIVDLKCGNPDRWSSPIANRLKKLGFSKLSESVG
ncbi:hypothetical protein BVC80_9009g34 [Macleaya cordata]|uniref:Uncharacterized protein n=1 Tax=Macleaya cordata TaxID=56857 RepID=A0A200QM63_MACCD|nr:hypothetical protein BVC80_9009g34 [Macleaya cordata]